MKRLIKLLVSLVVRACDVMRMVLLYLTGRKPPPICVVLYYHSVSARHRQLFARQMDVLLEVARPLSTDPPPALDGGTHYVAITFDDGFVSVLENAAPELRQRRIPWTIFVPSGCLGQSPVWLRRATRAIREDRVMTAEELRALARDPLVTIGSHTVAHAHLVEVGPEQAAVEMARSKADLESVLERSVSQFSYPFGARTPALDQQARRLGYRRLFSSDPRPAFQSSDEFVTGRINMDPDVSPLEFRLKVHGAYRWLAALRRE